MLRSRRRKFWKGRSWKFWKGRIFYLRLRKPGVNPKNWWVFRLEQGSDCRYCCVERRDRNILILIIERECAHGSVIHSDEWPPYSNLNAIGCQHSTVNHQQHYADPATGAHTQAIERSWLHVKTIMPKRMWGVGRQLFHSHLDHFFWKVMRKNSDDIFVSFWEDVQNVYRWNKCMEITMTCLFLPFLLCCSGRPHAVALTGDRSHTIEAPKKLSFV